MCRYKPVYANNVILQKQVWQNNDLKTWCNLTHEQCNDFLGHISLTPTVIDARYSKIFKDHLQWEINKSLFFYSFSLSFLWEWASVKRTELLTFSKIIWHKETYLSSSFSLIMHSKWSFLSWFVAFVMLQLKWADSSSLRFNGFDLKTSLQSQLSQTARSAARWSSEVRLENKNRTTVQNTKLYRSGYFRDWLTILFVIS